MRISFSNLSCSILSVYRPPALSKADFLSELTTLLEILVPLSSELVITGDFNYHLNCSSDQSVSQLLYLLDMFDLKQLVNFPTHNSGHTLDLFIKPCAPTLMSDIDFGTHSFTDHYSIHSVMNVPRFHRSQNKCVLLSPSIPQFFQLIFLPRLFIVIHPLTCNHIPLCSLLHCLLFLTTCTT